VWIRYRRAVAIAEAAAVLGLPFVRVKGESALRFDLVNLKLHFFGTVLWIRDLYLILLASIFILILFAVVTNVLGRVWCGWLCPQTVLIDLAEDLARAVSRRRARALSRLFLVPLSAVVAISLIWYFVPPLEALRALPEGGGVTAFFLSLWAAVFGMLGLAGRRFCATVCPYSMLQGSFFDKDTLVVSYDRGRDGECMDCRKCLGDCPMGIDIRDGLQRECIACARCVDACTLMTSRTGRASLIGYAGRVLRPKAFWLASAALLSAAVFIGVLLMRPDAEVIVSRDARQPSEGLNSYSYTVYNNGSKDISLQVSLGGPFALVGNPAVTARAYSMTSGKIMVRAEGEAHSVRFIFRGDGYTIEREAGFL
jgi:cytochrome c oxidase accessory protein FixG